MCTYPTPTAYYSFLWDKTATKTTTKTQCSKLKYCAFRKQTNFLSDRKIDFTRECGSALRSHKSPVAVFGSLIVISLNCTCLTKNRANSGIHWVKIERKRENGINCNMYSFMSTHNLLLLLLWCFLTLLHTLLSSTAADNLVAFDLR